MWTLLQQLLKIIENYTNQDIYTPSQTTTMAYIMNTPFPSLLLLPFPFTNTRYSLVAVLHHINDQYRVVPSGAQWVTGAKLLMTIIVIFKKLDWCHNWKPPNRVYITSSYILSIYITLGSFLFPQSKQKKKTYICLKVSFLYDHKALFLNYTISFYTFLSSKEILASCFVTVTLQTLQK